MKYVTPTVTQTSEGNTIISRGSCSKFSCGGWFDKYSCTGGVWSCLAGKFTCNNFTYS